MWYHHIHKRTTDRFRLPWHQCSSLPCCSCSTAVWIVSSLSVTSIWPGRNIFDPLQTTYAEPERETSQYFMFPACTWYCTSLNLQTMNQQLNHGCINLKCYDIISRRWADESCPRICTLQFDGPFVIHLYHQTGLVSSGTPTEHVHAFWICAMCAVCSTRLIFIDLNTIMKIKLPYKLWRSCLGILFPASW